MEIEWRTKNMNYICKNALSKMSKEFLEKISEHLNKSQGYKIPLQKTTKKNIINFISKANIKTSHYWNSFDHMFRSELSQLNNNLDEIKKSIQKLKS